MKNIRFIGARAKVVSSRLGLLSADARKEILMCIAKSLKNNTQEILRANAKDMVIGRRKGLSEGVLDRLLLTESRLNAALSDLKKVAGMQDLIGHVIESRELDNGLFIKRIRVPLGVIGMIYEARPNVTIDATALCLKSGNAVILKGGSDAMFSNRAMVKAIQSALEEMAGLTPEARLQDALQLIDSTNRKDTKELLQLHGIIDVIIPRGSKNLIDFVRENSKVPVIETGASVVHTYIHGDAHLHKAVDIIMNAKLRRVGICNTLDSLLLNTEIAEEFLKEFIRALPKNPYKATRLEIRADAGALEILKRIPAPLNFNLVLKKSHHSDFDQEFLDYILTIKLVKDLDQAIDHISAHSLKHSEAILTEDGAVAERFLNEVDAACVYWNASTMFSDGGEFGLGAEIGVSTQKLHVRGPFALEGLTSYKWVIEGSGQIRLP